MKKASVAVSLLASTCLGSAGSAYAQDQTIKVGLVAFVTGPLAGPVGNPMNKGMQLIVEAANAGEIPAPYAAKGFGGITAEPILLDEAGGATKQATEFRALVEQRGADAIVGFNSAGTCLAIAPIAEELKVVTVLGSCGANMVAEGKSRYVFHTTANLIADGVVSARYLKALKGDVKTFAGINPNFAYGQDSWRDFAGAMKVVNPGSQAVAEQFPAVGSNQYGADISKLIGLAPEATHTALSGTDLESFITQASARGLHTQTQFVLTAGEGVTYTMKDRMPDGVIIGARGAYGLFAHDTELNRWFRSAYEKRYDSLPNVTAYQGAQAVLALKIAYDKATAAAGARPTSDQLADALTGLEYEAFGTTISLARGKGHQAVHEHALGVYKFDAATGRPSVTDVKYFPGDCVNPPEGMSADEWVASGLEGAKCD